MLNKKYIYDFIDAGKYLIEEQYTDSEKLFAQGGRRSFNWSYFKYGTINLERRNCRCPFCRCNYNGRCFIPLTSGEWDEWGDPRIKKYYDYMLSYSPYDQIKNINYPNILVTSGFFDSQVQYWSH